jgi:DNA-directed RNA polymerase specialized sigma24 family protein
MSAAVDWLGRAFARPGASPDPDEHDDSLCAFRHASAEHFDRIGHARLQTWARWRSDPRTFPHDDRDARFVAHALRLLSRKERNVLVEHYGFGLSLSEIAARSAIGEKQMHSLRRIGARKVGMYAIALHSAWRVFEDRERRRERFAHAD